jgi:tetratricopeptide (TPR) repeat protein
VALLEPTGERYWLGVAHWVLGINYVIIGDFKLALEAEARADALGEAIGDPRLQSYAAWTTGAIYALTGEWEAGIDACKRGLERSSDPLNTAAALGFLGYAHLEKGDPVQAIPLLEQSVQQTGQFRYRQFQGLFTVFLSAAYLLDGQIEKARDFAIQGLEITRDAKYGYGLGVAQRALGRIAQVRGAFSEAESYFQEAFATFASIQARFEVGRIHMDLAELARAQGNQEAAAMHLKEAHYLFRTLQVIKYIERTERLARKFGVLRSEGVAL